VVFVRQTNRVSCTLLSLPSFSPDGKNFLGRVKKSQDPKSCVFVFFPKRKRKKETVKFTRERERERKARESHRARDAFDIPEQQKRIFPSRVSSFSFHKSRSESCSLSPKRRCQKREIENCCKMYQRKKGRMENTHERKGRSCWSAWLQICFARGYFAPVPFFFSFFRSQKNPSLPPSSYIYSFEKEEYITTSERRNDEYRRSRSY
jgi:hypothetical protein